jgi:hypothetical protein
MHVALNMLLRRYLLHMPALGIQYRKLTVGKIKMLKQEDCMSQYTIGATYSVQLILSFG